MSLKVKSFSDIMAEGEAEAKRLQYAFTETKTDFIFRYPVVDKNNVQQYAKTNSQYCIPKNTIKRPEDIIEWVHQMNTKLWVEKGAMDMFLVAATKHLKLKFPWN